MNVGIDILEVDRIKNIMKRNKYFLDMCFCREEIDQIKNKNSICQSIAARFCAKEAFFKCLGKKISKLKDLKDVKILNLESGKPIIYLSSSLKDKYKGWNFSLSISHSKNFSCAVVISSKILFHDIWR